jgi:hypothetical protein
MKTCRIYSTPYSSSRQDLSFHWYVPKIDDSLQIPKTWVKKLFQFSKRNLLKKQMESVEETIKVANNAVICSKHFRNSE